MSNSELAEKYLMLINDNYTLLKSKMRKFCKEKDYEFDEDIFSDSYLKVYEKILKNGLNDPSEQGMLDYTFIAFKLNTKREKQYKRVASRDYNISSDEIDSLYEEWANEHQDTAVNKVKSDLWKDFAAKEIITELEKEFGADKARLFASKYLVKGNTYKKLAEKYDRKGIRNEIVEMKRWLQENLSKEDVRKRFYNEYDEIL